MVARTFGTRTRIHSFCVLILALTLLLPPVAPGGGNAAARQEYVKTTCVQGTQPYAIEICLIAPDSSMALIANPVIAATVEVGERDIRVLSVDFALDGRRVLSDFDIPYEFTLPIGLWDPGEHNLSVSARTSDKQRSVEVTTQVTFAEGVEPPVVSRPFTATAGRPQEPDKAFVIAAIGDSAGGSMESMAVADLIESWGPNLMLYLGDVYNSGRYTEFLNWYDPDEYVGRFRDITLPTPGNHEYSGRDEPEGYMRYWGDPPHFYSVDTAGWHIVSLDSNPRFNQLDAGSEQLAWLEADLSSTASACTLVFFHHPPFSAGSYADEGETLIDIWSILTAHGVTLVLTGHDHNYQRWERLDASGHRDPAGVVSAIVGTGGQSEYAPKVMDEDRLAAPVIKEAGALRVELNPGGAAMQFVTVDGIVRDADIVPCDRSSPDSEPPAAPSGLKAVTGSDGVTTLTWEPTRDNVGVHGYAILRDGIVVAEDLFGTAYVDKASGTATYRIVAVDGEGNRSPMSEQVIPQMVTEPLTLIDDTFASGSLIRWDRVEGLAIHPAENASGWVARARGSTHDAWAQWSLPNQEPDALGIRVRFRTLSQGENPVVLLRLRDSDGSSLLSVNIGENGTIGTFNNVTSSGQRSTRETTPDVWHEAVMVLSGAGNDRTLTIALDGEVISDLSGPVDLGTDGIAAIQLGDSTSGRVYDVMYERFTVLANPDDRFLDAAVRP